MVSYFTSPAGAVAKDCGEYVCLCVCLSVREDISQNHTSDLHQIFLGMLPVSVARSSAVLTTGRIAYRREGGDGSAQCGRSVIYDCLVLNVVRVAIFLTANSTFCTAFISSEIPVTVSLNSERRKEIHASSSFLRCYNCISNQA